MSKCDLRIVFDRTDRQYRGGEQVSGTVYVQVNEDVECDAIELEHFWQTHGRGNTATGPKPASRLYRGPLRAGQTLSYPFQFIAPIGPPTYHGTYLNVDHYLMARVQIPWAIDPKVKEEYVLLPSGAAYGNLPAFPGRGLMAKQAVAGAGLPLGVAMIFFGFLSIIFFPCGLVLIPLGLFVLFFALRKVLAEKKIGKVSLSCGSQNVAPGASLPVKLTFTPRHSSRLNRIVAELVGQERCVSGSGTNRTTHTHKFHERAVELLPECDVTAGRPVQVETVVPIPRTNAFTFHAKDNDLVWELEVRVDIPLWPDWTEKRTVIVRPPLEVEVVEATVVEEPSRAPRFPAPPVPPVPATFPQVREAVRHGRPAVGGQAGTGSPFAQAEPGAARQPEPVAADATGSVYGSLDVETDAAALDKPGDEQTVAEPPSMEQVGEPEVPVVERPAPSVPTTDPALVGIIGRIASADRYSRDREQIIEENSENSFDCAIEITRAERTYSYIPDARFRKGRTVTGKLHGTDCEVSVQLIEARNDEIDSLQPGSLLSAKCRPLKWNTIYDRLEMREA